MGVYEELQERGLIAQITNDKVAQVPFFTFCSILIPIVITVQILI